MARRSGVTFVTDGTPHPAMSMIAIIAAAWDVAHTRGIELFIGLKTPCVA